jgi:hypothetical protein
MLVIFSRCLGKIVVYPQDLPKKTSKFYNWLVVLTILKNHGVRQWEGWHPMYEMENIIHVPNHQNKFGLVYWVTYALWRWKNYDYIVGDVPTHKWGGANLYRIALNYLNLVKWRNCS